MQLLARITFNYHNLNNLLKLKENNVHAQRCQVLPSQPQLEADLKYHKDNGQYL